MNGFCVRRSGTGRRQFLRGIVPFSLFLLSACSAQPPQSDTTAAPQAPQLVSEVAADARLFYVDPEASELRLRVYREGPLAHLGHNHVILGRIEGQLLVADTATGSAFRLRIPLADLSVDPAVERGEEGAEFAAQVDDAARNGTRENMLGSRVLDADNYPVIQIVSAGMKGPLWNPDVTARVTLHGVTHDLSFPAAVVQYGATLEVVASFRLRQTEFGIVPLSALGGGLRVADAIDIRVRIIARGHAA